MGSPADPPETLLRERAYLALLLIVGAGAVAVGVYQTFRSGGSSLSAIFDLALGACVLLVTWLFLAPSAWPELFEGPRGRDRPVRRPYLGPTPSPLLEPARTPRASAPTPSVSAIPRWADPLVHPRMEGPIRPTVAASPHHATRSAIPRPARMAPPRPAPSAPPPVLWKEPDLPRAVPTDLAELGPPRWDPERSAGRGTYSLEVLEELDRIEAELRTFVPVESTPAPTPVEGLEDLVD